MGAAWSTWVGTRRIIDRATRRFTWTAHALNDAALSVFWPIEQPGQTGVGSALHRAQRDGRVYPIPIAVLA